MIKYFDFFIQGNLEVLSESFYLNCYLLFCKEYYKFFLDVIGILIYNVIEYEGGEVNCIFICKNLFFNCVIVLYKEQKRIKIIVNLKVRIFIRFKGQIFMCIFE